MKYCVVHEIRTNEEDAKKVAEIIDGGVDMARMMGEMLGLNGIEAERLTGGNSKDDEGRWTLILFYNAPDDDAAIKFANFMSNGVHNVVARDLPHVEIIGQNVYGGDAVDKMLADIDAKGTVATTSS